MRCAQPRSSASSSAAICVGRSRASTWVCARDGPRSEEIDSGLCVRSSPLLGYAHESDLGPKQSTRRIERQRSKDGWVPDRSSCTYRMRCAGRGWRQRIARVFISDQLNGSARESILRCRTKTSPTRAHDRIRHGRVTRQRAHGHDHQIAALVIGPNPAITFDDRCASPLHAGNRARDFM